MPVSKICVRKVDIISPDDSAQMAAERMHDRKVGSLVVVNPAYEPIGIVTDRDLAVRVVAPGLDAAQTAVEEVMTASPRTIDEETSIAEALHIMRTGEFRRLPVVSRRRLVGLVSLDDILDTMLDQFTDIRGLLREESPRSLAQI